MVSPISNSDWLYLRHFGLHEPPFTMTPDSRFFFSHQACQAAINTLLVATRSGEGFTKVVGEVGTGKTLLCRKFLGMLDENFLTAYIPNPYVEPMTLLLAVADELGVPYYDGINQHKLLKTLTNFLIETYADYQCTVVVCLDEAHAMPLETLEAVRLLSNLETPRRKLLQLVLFGQPELDQRLAQPSIRQLKQRIGFSSTLAPLDRRSMEDYLSHRLNIAGYRGPRPFSTAAVRKLHRASGGIPRLVNVLAHKALLTAYGEGAREITARHIMVAIADTESTQRPGWWRRLTHTLVGANG